jgi:plastocyanin
MERFFVRRCARMLPAVIAVALAACGGGDGYTTGLEGGGGGGGGGGTMPVVTTSVTVTDGGFDPAAIRVSPGATVTWTWTGSIDHSVNFSSATITDSSIRTNGTHSTALPSTAGTYSYVCDVHASMTGTVQVQ